MVIGESLVISLTSSAFSVSKLWITLYYIDFGNKIIELNLKRTQIVSSKSNGLLTGNYNLDN